MMEPQQLPLGLGFSSVFKSLPPVRKRIQAGAALLDEKRGLEWRELVDIETLDMASPNEDILGQLFDHYSIGLCELGIRPHRSVELGFSIIDPESSSADYEFAVLTKCWREFVKRQHKATK